jgi:hypothetical protein
MKIIKDVNGETLRLTKTHLKEITGEMCPGDKWSMPLSELKRSILYDSWYVRLFLTGDSKRPGAVSYSVIDARIGCRTFSVRTFNQILTAAGVK